MENNNYKRIILPQAESDIEEILKYISKDLHNPTAALKLLNDMNETMDGISRFPYSRPLLKNQRITLDKEYRRADVSNFVLIYKIVEELKEVRIMAAFYASSDIISRIFKRI